MAAKKEVKPPKQLRVTFKDQIEHECDENWNIIGEIVLPRLGFAQEYNPHVTTFAKRKQTQDEWAYADWHESCFELDGKTWTKRPRRTEDGLTYMRVNGEFVYEDVIVPEHLQPIVIDNVPLEDFRIQKSIARGGRYNNKLWRVLDPRGFELEISTECFAEIVLSGVVDEGVIKGACIWKTPKILARV